MKSKLKSLLRRIYALQFRRYKLYFGSSNENVYYIIRFFPREGLMSMLYKACGHVEYALNMGYIPIIDMTHFRTMYRNCIFGDFCRLKLEDYAKVKNKGLRKKYIIAAVGTKPEESPLFGSYWAYAFEHFAEKGRWFWNHFSINEDIMYQVQKDAAELSIPSCIGVLLRGTDYIALKPDSHPVQPDISEVFVVLDDWMQLYGKSAFFLVTEDAVIRDLVKQKYGNRILTVSDDVYAENYKAGKMLADTVEKSKAYQMGMVYMKKIVLLSMCKGLVAAKTNGSLMALVMNGGKYENVYLFDKGLYLS